MIQGKSVEDAPEQPPLLTLPFQNQFLCLIFSFFHLALFKNIGKINPSSPRTFFGGIIDQTALLIRGVVLLAIQIIFSFKSQYKKMLIGIGAVVATMVMLSKDLGRKKISKIKERPDTIHICLTGGPCGGKSQGIDMLYNTLKTITVPVFVVPEAATIIGSAGFTLDLSKCSAREIESFQIYLMRLQLNLENLVTSMAKTFMREKKKSVVLCDRGMLDGKAYAGDSNWAKMLNSVKVDEEEILGRYEAVVHMVTAAEGAQQFYAGNTVRHESIDSAIELDRKIQRCYHNHPNRYIITNQFIVHNFEEKKGVLLAQVYQILLKLIQENNIIDYYQDYVTRMRKGSEDDIAPEVSPYMVRKLKYKKFMKRKGGDVRVGSRKKRSSIS